MTLVFSIALVLALLSGFGVAAWLSQTRLHWLLSALIGVICSAAALGLTLFVLVNFLYDAAITFTKTYLPALLDKLMMVLTLYQQAKG